MIKNKNKIIFLIYIISFLFIFRTVESQSNINSNNKINLILLFLILIFTINIVILKYEVLWKFISGNYETIILIFSVSLLLVYFVPKIPFQSITGLFAAGPTTTSTTIPTTIPESESKTAEPSAKKETTTTTTETTTTITGPSTSSTSTTTTTSQTTVTSSTSTTITPALTITFDRRLDCHKCGQHKASPLTDVTMTITATVSESLQNTYLIDYYPKEWTVTNSNGGQISSFNSNYNKIQWSISNVDDLVTRWYVVKSPQRTSPPTDYYFFSEIEIQQSNTWRVKVADPTELLTQPYDCSDANVVCDETTVTITHGNGSEMMINYQKPVNFFNSTLGDWQAINTMIIPGSFDGYDYGIEQGYQAYYKSHISYGDSIKYCKEGYCFTTQPSKITYRNQLGSNDDISQLNTSSIGNASDNKFRWNNTFTDCDLEYTYEGGTHKEYIILKQKPRDPAEYLGDVSGVTFDAAHYIKFPVGVDMYVNDTKRTTDFKSSERIEFRNESNIILYYLPKPYAFDSNESLMNTVNLVYDVVWDKAYNPNKERLVWFYIQIPYEWLNSSEIVYPIYIDPTTEFEYNKTVDYYRINNTLNDYFFNASNAEQRANDIQDYWTKNDICIGLYFGNSWHEFCGINYDWTWYNSTNYTTYSNLTGTANMNYAGYKVDLRLEYYLEGDYPEVLGKLTIENVGNKDVTDSYIKIHAYDIMINQTYENDTFRINTTSFWESWSGYSEHWLNESLNLVLTQDDLVSRKYAVFDNETESWVELEWNDSYWRNGDSYPMNYNISVDKGSEYNAPVELLLLTGQFNKNDVISTNFRWADAIKQNFSEANTTITEILHDWYEIKGKAEIIAYDWNASIEMKQDGTVKVKYNVSVLNENHSAIIAYNQIAWKFNSYELIKANSFDTLRCPRNKTNVQEIFQDFASEEAKLKPRNLRNKTSYYIGYLLVDDKTGDLTYYKYESTPSENISFRSGRVKFSDILNTKNLTFSREFDVDFGYVGTSHCINFPIPMHVKTSFLNVTMPGLVVNFTLPQDIVIENYTEGNSLIARFDSWPCCGISEEDINLTITVCS